MPVTWMKAKYNKNATQYKLQKSTHANSGKSNKKSNKRAKAQKPLNGEKLLLVDMSGTDKFCPVTGNRLPKWGMVVRYKGVYYADYEASARAD